MVQPFQQEDRDQGCPNLDAQGVFTGAHETLHLEVLFERLEKKLNLVQQLHPNRDVWHNAFA